MAIRRPLDTNVVDITGDDLASDIAISTTGNIATTGSGTLAIAGTSTLTGALTASGGIFRDKKYKELSNVTPAESTSHPNWKMGKKISIDSATMMNKGLEVIEASLLFNINPDKINVYIHLTTFYVFCKT